MSIKLQPLLNRANLLPNESLLSLLIRLTELNSYESLSVLKGLVSEDPDHLGNVSDDFEIPSKATVYEKLSALTQLDTHSIYMATLHRFVPVLTSPPDTIASMQLPNGKLVPYHSQFRFPIQLRSQSMAQFCPKCLAEEAYHKFIWSPVAVSICLQHECLLVDRCPKCNKDVSILTIVKTQCEQCQTDLTKAQTIPVANNDFGLLAQQVILSWFMNYKPPDAIAHLLPQYPVSVLYKVLDDLQKCIKNVWNADWSYMYEIEEEISTSEKGRSQNEQVLSPYESYRLYSTAFKGLFNWPNGFYEFLLSYRNRRVSQTRGNNKRVTPQKGELITGSLYDNLGYLYSSCLTQYWKYPEFSFMREVFVNHVADNYWLNRVGELGSFCRNNPEYAERCQWVDLLNAARFLNMSPEEVELWFRNEQIICKSLGGHIIKLVKKEKVFFLNNPMNKLMPMGRVVRFLGLKESIIKDLVGVGLISSQNSSVRNKFSVQEFTATSVIAFLENMLHHIKDKPIQTTNDTNEWLDIAKVGRILYKTKLDMGFIFQQIQQGNLWMYRSKDQLSRLGDMHFKLDEIKTLIESNQ